MPDLSSHTNVYSSAIALLHIRGWTITINAVDYELEDSWIASYEASRDGTEILADNPLELLALAAIHEHHHPHSKEAYWWLIESDEPELLGRLEDEALERSFLNYLERDESAALKVIEDSLKDSVTDDDYSAEEIVGISKDTLNSLILRFPQLGGIGK